MCGGGAGGAAVLVGGAGGAAVLSNCAGQFGDARGLTLPKAALQGVRGVSGYSGFLTFSVITARAFPHHLPAVPSGTESQSFINIPCIGFLLSPL